MGKEQNPNPITKQTFPRYLTFPLMLATEHLTILYHSVALSLSLPQVCQTSIFGCPSSEIPAPGISRISEIPEIPDTSHLAEHWPQSDQPFAPGRANGWSHSLWRSKKHGPAES